MVDSGYREPAAGPLKGLRVIKLGVLLASRIEFLGCLATALEPCPAVVDHIAKSLEPIRMLNS